MPVREDVHEQPAVVRQPARGCAQRARGSSARARASRPRRCGRSAAPVSKSLMSAVTTVTLSSPRRARLRGDELALRAEFETAMMELARKPAREMQRQRAPAASEFEDALAICDLRALGRQRRASALRPRPASRHPSATTRAVLQVRTEHALEERAPAPRSAGALAASVATAIGAVRSRVEERAEAPRLRLAAVRPPARAAAPATIRRMPAEAPARARDRDRAAPRSRQPPRRPRHEGARRLLIAAIVVAAAAERLRLGRRNAGDAEQR